MNMIRKVILVVLTVMVCGYATIVAVLYKSPDVKTVYALSEEMRSGYKDPAQSGKISLNFSPYYIDGTSPGSAVSEESIRRLLNAISPFCDTIRTFASSETEALYSIAKNEYDMRILAGAWLTGDEAADKKELDTLIKLANTGLADMLLCGSEGIYRGDYSAKYAIRCINYVKMSLVDKTIPVSTSDTAGMWLNDKSGLIGYADFLCYTYYPYFEGIPAEKGAEAFDKMYDKLVTTARGKPIVCSETAFPSGGESMGKARPSRENSVRYFNDLYAWSVENKAEVIFFEAADESWKGSPESVETHWGLCDTFGAVKPQYWKTLSAIVSDTAAVESGGERK
jgi:exo-beta-1,3-glucanase (GH17 family)